MVTGMPFSISLIASSVSVRPKARAGLATAWATCLLPDFTWAFRFRSRKNAFALSSPQAANRQAACVAVVPNSGFARQHRSYHCESVMLGIDFGQRSSETWFVFTNSTRARAAKPDHKPAGDFTLSGKA